jgi:hypothetical protein
MHGAPTFGAGTLITDPNLPNPQPLETFTWGTGGPAARSVMLAIGRHRTSVPTAAGGTFVALAGPMVHDRDVRVAFRYAGGRRIAAQNGPEVPTLPGQAAPVAGTERIEARAPDPDGGLPWAVVSVPASHGGYCLSQDARVVGARAGVIAYDLGVLTDAHFAQCDRAGYARGLPTRADPLHFSGEFGMGDPNEGPDPQLGRSARRTLPGFTEIIEVAAPDVRSVTLATPRDVRTVVPSGPHHVILAVYDGTFPVGAAAATATFADGTVKVVDVPVGGV